MSCPPRSTRTTRVRRSWWCSPSTRTESREGRAWWPWTGCRREIGDLVLVVDEGGSARTVIGDESAVTIRTAICGIVDRVDIDDGRRAP